MSQPPEPGRKRLGKRFYVILSRPTEKGGDRAAVRAQHFAFIDDLERRGILFAAGPEVDESDEPQGPGIIVIRAPNLEAAAAVADSDPFHRLGYRRYELRTWRISEGGFTLRTRFSGQTFELD